MGKKQKNIEIDWSHFEGIANIILDWEGFIIETKGSTLVINQDTETYQLKNDAGEIVKEVSY